jgi:2-dehydro-3-deoxygluconokinase
LKKIVTFGEIMMRLAPQNYEKIVQAKSFDIKFGGGEANVAIALSMLNQSTYFVSALPKNELGEAAIYFLRSLGVNTENVLRIGKRIGLNFLEIGASVRASKVIYDREESSVSQLTSSDISWESIFKDKDWFHITGITPALSNLSAKNSIEAVQVAKEMGLKVSCDLNYRNKLWSKEEAKETMTKICKFVDVLIANEEDASDVFGIKTEQTDVNSGVLNEMHYKEVAEQLMEITNAKKVAITLRESISASDNNWSAILYNGKEFFNSKKYSLHIVDRVGGGDSFAAGLIFGLLNNSEQFALDFAVAASALKHTIHGDVNYSREEEVLSVMGGNISGRVQR